MKKCKFCLFAILVVVAAFIACEKENKTDLGDQEVYFEVSTSKLKSSLNYELTDVKKIKLTIKNADGSATKYNASEVAINQMNGSIFSDKLILKTGSYSLTEFLLLDSVDNVIFATPHEGSSLAHYVEDPLPILFNISKNTNSTINVSVVSTKNKQPSEFGFVEFPISKVNLPIINILVGVTDKETGKLINSKITISGSKVVPNYEGSGFKWIRYSQSKKLAPIANNLVAVKDTSIVIFDFEYTISEKFDDFNIVIEKEGYIPFCKTYTREDLKLMNDSGNNTPLFIQLKKLKKNTAADVEGNIYNTIKIGSQTWMTENLRSVRLKDGTSMIGLLNYIYGDHYYPSFGWYADNKENSKLYGNLYSQYAISYDVCPSGWHVPNDNDWNELIQNLGGEAIAGGKLKGTGTEHWLSPNAGATNSSGFNALPGGLYGYNPEQGDFSGMGEFGQWASSPGGAWRIYYDSEVISKEYAKYGTSVRCIKD